MSVGLWLASASPRRREILSSLGVRFEVHATDVDERVLDDERPEQYVARVARSKRQAARIACPRGAVLAADTTVTVDGLALGKPVDDSDARAMLGRLNGRAHLVLTAISIEVDGREHDEVVRTEVRFAPIDAPTIARYVATGEGRDKAGAYAIQGLGGAFVAGIAGSYSNVVGLPAHETISALRRLGVLTDWP